MEGAVPWRFEGDPGPESEKMRTEVPPVDESALFGDLDDVDQLDMDGNVEPVDWRTVPPSEAEAHWLALDRFVTWLRTTYGLPPTIVPPLWHRHPELVWELSALHTHWLACFEPGGSGSGPIAWHADFADARERLREWVSTCGTRLDHDRPTRVTAWPGEPPAEAVEERSIGDRESDFAAFVAADLAARRAAQARATRRARP